MRKLPLPTFDDAAAIVALSANRKLKSFPLIAAYTDTIKAGYLQYHAVAGDPDAVVDVPIPEPAASWLRKHYKKPPKALAELKEMRQRYLGLPCSMCGSFHAHTLDHVFPKDDFPAFSVFTRNLVPSCDCNLKKGTALRGNIAGARVLHPYYDDCLNERLFSAKITDPGPTIKVDIEVILDPNHPRFAAAEFHLNSVIRKTGVFNWMGDQWVKLLRHPPSIIGTLNFIPQTEQNIIDALTVYCGYRDTAHQSQNNWESMFVQGLLDPTVTSWLFQRLTADGRTAPEAPLDYLARA